MSTRNEGPQQTSVAPFDRSFSRGSGVISAIGSGSIGGKARGLALMSDIVEEMVRAEFAPGMMVNIPTLTVIASDHFDRFMEENDLYEIAFSNQRDDVIAHAFQKAKLPTQVVGDLLALTTQVHTPLAVRSSSMLEDAMFRPFAGVYGTKMIPNNQHDPDTRFRKLVEAIKYVYASTFFNTAKQYISATEQTIAGEKMAVIIQEVVGSRRDDRFYPHVSGVARSYNFYPTGNAQGEEGIVELALGLGRTIVDDAIGWAYCPAYPKANPPYSSIDELLDQSQLKFWAVNMGTPAKYDPIRETEYLAQYSLKEAEYDGTLEHVASTYNAQDDTLVMGIRERGARLIDFAPILKAGYIELNELIKTLLAVCEDKLGCEVEIEFAMTLNCEDGPRARFGFLQVRPMVVSGQEVDVLPEELDANDVVAASEIVLGNGVILDIRDVVFVKPEAFAPASTREIPPLLEQINRRLVAAGRPYLLIGFGRWGTTDPWGGIPVAFGQISGAKVIVEATRPDMDFRLSQGTHFFQNVTSFKICYFSVRHTDDRGIDWNWLRAQPVVEDTEFVSHCELTTPLEIRVDGRRRRGVIRHG